MTVPIPPMTRARMLALQQSMQQEADACLRALNIADGTLDLQEGTITVPDPEEAAASPSEPTP